MVAGALSYVAVIGGAKGLDGRPALALTLDGKVWTQIEGAGAPAANGNVSAVGADGIVVFGSIGGGTEGPAVPVPWFGAATSGP